MLSLTEVINQLYTALILNKFTSLSKKLEVPCDCLLTLDQHAEKGLFCRQNSSTSAILVRDPGTPRSLGHHPDAQSRHVGVKENLNRAKYRVSSLEKQVKLAAMKKLETDIELRTALNTLTPSNQNIPGKPS